MEDQPSVDPAVGDVTESIAFGLLNDAVKLGQVRCGVIEYTPGLLYLHTIILIFLCCLCIDQ
jgi:hypothetical protein